MKAVAIILARKGSKGVKGKNMAKVGGVPLIARAIRESKKSFDDVVVSTDWNELAELARQEGAIVIDRPKELAGDRVSSEECIAHVLEVVPGYDIAMLVQNTSPFNDSGDMNKIIELVSGEYASAIAVCETHRYRWQIADGGIEPRYDYRARRQDRPPFLEEAGSLYGFKVEQFMKNRNLFEKPTGFVVVPRKRAIDINTQEDLEKARMYE